MHKLKNIMHDDDTGEMQMIERWSVRVKWKRRWRKIIAGLTLVAMTTGLVPGMDALVFRGAAETYQPARVVQIDAVSDINPTAHLIFPSSWQNAGTMTVTGKVRIESMSSLGAGAGFFVNNAAAKELVSYKGNTNGWVDLSLTVTYSDARLIFGGWYAGGKMSFADLVIKKADGTVLYSLADDSVFDTFAHGENLRGRRGDWIFQTYNNVSKFTVEAGAYQPERTVTIDSTSDINPTAHFIFPSSWQNAGPLTVTAKVKVTSLSALGSNPGFFVHNAAAQSKANYNAVTDGWVDLSLTMTYSDARLIFGGWYARGKMSFADLVIKKADGTVLYSLADDTAFDTFALNQDIKGGRGNWIFQTYNNVSKFTVKGGAARPERILTIDSTSDINPTAYLAFPSSWQNAGTMTVTGKIKVDSIASLGSGCHFFVNNLAGKELASYPSNTNGWINLSLKVTYSDARLIFGGWYAGGQMKFADLVIKKSDGTVLYSLADDTVFGSSSFDQLLTGTTGYWTFTTYNNVSKFICTTVEEAPVIREYGPERELIINSTSDTNPTAEYTFPSAWANQGPFRMTGKVRVESISSLGSSPRFFLQNAQGDTLASYEAATNGWEDLSVTAAYSDGGFTFGGQNAAGRMRIADLKIYASDGTLLYRLSTDPVFESVSPDADIVGSKGDWMFGKNSQVSKFSVTTWILPNRYLMIDSSTDINPTAHLIFPSEWQNKGDLTVTGKIRIESLALMNDGGKFFVNNAAAQELVTYTADTNGWINLSLTVDYSDARLIFGGWYAKGQMKFADLEIKTSDGTVLYSLNDDDTFAVYSDNDNIVGGRGMWIFQTYNNVSSMHVIAPPVDADYVPDRSLYVSPVDDINTKAHFIFPSDWASYGTIYLTGYLKVENFRPQNSDARFSVHNSPGVNYFTPYYADTDGFQRVVIPATYSDERYIFGSWKASGDFILADLEIRKQDGTLLYSLAEDRNFDNIGTNVDMLGSRGYWIFQNYNDEAGFKVRSKVNPARSLVIESTSDTNPTAQFVFPSAWQDAGRLHLTGKMKINGFSPLGSDANVYIGNAAGASFKTFTGNTKNWETLAITAEYGDGRFVLGGWNAAGKITFADLEITNDKGEVLYSLADDPAFDGLEAQTDIAGERGGWSLQKHDHVSRFVLLDGRQWDYTMTSGRYTVSGGIISAAVSSSAAEDFLADIDPGIDGTVKLFEGTAPVTTGFAATGMTVSLYNRGGQKLSEYTVAVKGDLNADGVVNAADVTEMQAHIAGTKSFTGVFLQAGDLNGDGSITAADVPLLQQLAAAYADEAGNTVIDSYQDIVTMTPSQNGANSGTLTVVGPGSEPARIVVSAFAPSKVMEAAEFLQETIYDMTGTRLEIVDDTAVHTGNLLLVGDSRYTRRLGMPRLSGYPESEKVLLMTRGNRLVLMGNDCGNYTGTYNAVTMFLESLGCGWFGPEALWEEIPDVSSISVGSYQIEHTPQFTNRINRVYDSNREMGTRWYQGGDKMLFGHGLPSLVSRESYFSAHPEWFCLINGQRNPYGVDWWQYCYSNQALATEIAGKVIQFFDRNPDYTQYTLAANDGWYEGWCECSACAALGSRTDQILTFTNRVAAIVGEKYPDKKLTVLSYFANFYAPTRNFTMEPNLEIQFTRETNMYQPVSSGFNMGSSYYPETGNTYTVTWKDNVANWQARTGCENYGIWEWYCVAAAKPEWQYIPWVQGRVAIQNQQYWKSIGADYIYYDQGPLPGYYETQDDYDLRWPLWYVASKGMWDASLTSEQILKDACRKLYGSAADAMYGYYKCLEDISAECTARSVVWYSAPANQMYTSANINRVNATVATVRQSLSGVTATQRARIENQIALWETAKQHI